MSAKNEIKIWAVILLVFLPAYQGFSQQQVKETLFHDAQVLLKDAEKVEAPLYSPTLFQKGFELYSKAEKDFKAGKKLESIKKKLHDATLQLKKSIEITQISKLALAEMTVARQAALQQGSQEWAPDLFRQAEEFFRKAAAKVEDGKTNDGKTLAKQGSKLYRETELTAIKNRILDDAWKALKQCEEQNVMKYAPITLEKAMTAAAKAESILDQDRYDQDNAAAVAADAAYQAKHALFLASVIKELQQKKDSMENYLLDVEKQFDRISDALNLDLEFDGGFQDPAYRMVEAILEMRKREKKQQEKIQELSTTVDNLSSELSHLKSGQLKELSGKLSELEKIVEAERLARERFERIKQNFAPGEAKVIQQGDNIVIRLYGINFPSGKSIIHPDYFPLLTKVIKAIAEFPDPHVRIEGHTDSRGSNAINEKLSTDRANSVVQYVLANSNLDPSRVTGIGYGEDRPIASNDTEEGRSLNRRIDVVIIPGKK